MEFDNPESLAAQILADLNDVVTDVSQFALATVRQNVQNIVYDPYSSMVRNYKRRHGNGEYGFYESWDIDRFNFDSNIKSATIYSNPDIMDAPHGEQNVFTTDYEGNSFFDREDVELTNRNNILDRIIARGTDYDYYVPEEKSPYGAADNWWTKPRDYMTPTIVYMDANFKKEVSSSFKNKGINIEIT